MVAAKKAAMKKSDCKVKRKQGSRVSALKYEVLLKTSLKIQAEFNQLTSENEKMSDTLALAQEENLALKSEISRMQTKLSIGSSLMTTYREESKSLGIMVKSYRAVLIDISQSTELVPVGE